MKKKPANSKENLPGYPHYPAKEDLMNADAENRIDADVEDVISTEPANQRNDSTPIAEEETAEYIEMVPGTEADVTDDDMYALGSKDRDMDNGDDEKLLPLIMEGPDLTGDDLDVPGSDEDRVAAEEAGSEDEENKFYSFGQD